MQKKDKFSRTGKIFGFMVGLIGLIASLIGIYSFINQKEQEEKFTYLTEKIFELQIKINNNIDELKIERMRLEKNISVFESMLNHENVSKREIMAQVNETKNYHKSFESVAKQTEKSIDLLSHILQKVKTKPRESIPHMEQERLDLEKIIDYLHSKKIELNTQRRLSGQAIDSMQKMEESALKRLSIKV